MLFRNWIINARIGKGNQRDFFPIRSSLRVLQNSLSFFRVYDKCLLYCVLWTEWGFRYLSAFFHCRKRWKVLRQTFFQSQPNDFSFSAKRFFILSRTKWSLPEGCLKHLSVYNTNVMRRLSCNLKDERSFCKNLGEV